MGMWINVKGNLASKFNFGPMHISVKLQLYEACIVPAILYQVEAWNKLSNEEIKMLESIQQKTLCKILEIPKTTPYLGLLHELGMWTMEYRLAYRKIMLYHNIIQSKDDRLVKRIIEQQREEKQEGTFYKEVERWTGELSIKVEEIKQIMKPKMKERIKEEVKKKMEEKINKATKFMKKMRFITAPVTLKRQEMIRSKQSK